MIEKGGGGSIDSLKHKPVVFALWENFDKEQRFTSSDL